MERLPAYDGVLTARVQHMLEEAKKHNPSADTLNRSGVTQVESSAAVLTTDPNFAGLVEVKQV